MPYFEASILSDMRGTIDMVVDGRQYEQVSFGQPRIANGVPSYDVWASFRAIDATSASSEGFAPLDYDVDTRIADDLSLDGTTTLHLKAERGGERVVPARAFEEPGDHGNQGGEWRAARLLPE